MEELAVYRSRDFVQEESQKRKLVVEILGFGMHAFLLFQIV